MSRCKSGFGLGFFGVWLGFLEGWAVLGVFGRTPGIFSSPGELLWVMSDDSQGLHLTRPPFKSLVVFVGGIDEYTGKAPLCVCGYVHQSKICCSNWYFCGRFVLGAGLTISLCLPHWGGNLGGVLALSLPWWLRAVLKDGHGERQLFKESFQSCLWIPLGLEVGCGYSKDRGAEGAYSACSSMSLQQIFFLYFLNLHL